MIPRKQVECQYKIMSIQSKQIYRKIKKELLNSSSRTIGEEFSFFLSHLVRQEILIWKISCIKGTESSLMKPNSLYDYMVRRGVRGQPWYLIKPSVEFNVRSQKWFSYWIQYKCGYLPFTVSLAIVTKKENCKLREKRNQKTKKA